MIKHSIFKKSMFSIACLAVFIPINTVANTTLLQNQTLTNDAFNNFGADVAMSNQHLAVASDDGSFIYQFSDGLWQLESTLSSIEGRSVAIDGNTAIVGNDQGPNGEQFSRGSVSVYEQSNNNWSQVALLSLGDGASFDDFGSSVAISGDYLVVGGEGRNEGNGDRSGAAYVYERINGNWTQVAVITGSGSDAFERFGSSVAIDGNTIVVGSKQDGTFGPSSGAAYVFERNGGSWTEVALLNASNPTRDDEFGNDVAVQNGRIVIGRRLADTNGLFNSGSVFVFERTAGSWNEVAELSSDLPRRTGFFGESVALDNNTIVATGSGIAYVFELDNGVWTQQFELESSSSLDGFGIAATLEDERVVVNGYQSRGLARGLVSSFNLQPTGICEDPDGDGWGWDGTESCQVTTAEESGVSQPSNTAVCVDSDGDGWGWDGISSCRVTDTSSNSVESTDACVDADGDGWGWDGTQSCRVTNQSTDEGSSSAECIDFDGDGWGWDGIRSCRI